MMNRALLQLFRQLMAATACLLILSTAYAQNWPSRPVVIVHPYAPGGPADTMARALAQQLEGRLKQAFVVDGRAGGAATIGTSFVARAKPDGYTLLMGTSAGHVVTPLLQKISYDGIADFSFIAVVANQPNVVVVHPSLGVESLQGLFEFARKNPGKLNYASAGMGGATHLGMEALAQRAKIQITHVPYNGAAPVMKDLLGAQVQMGMLNLAATQAFVKDGKIKALAYGGQKRTILMPDVPTLEELGYGSTVNSTWYTLAAPKDTPAWIIEIIRQAVKDAAADPAYQAVLGANGAEILSLSPSETTAFVQKDKTAMTQLLESLNLTSK